MKKPYLRKIGDASGFRVWEVDGEYIRKNMDEEFTSYGQNYRFKFIPKKEFWIDRERVPGDEKYYIDSMLNMNRLLSDGFSHDEAVKIADRLEKRERKNSSLAKKVKKMKHKKELLNKIHKKLLKEYSTEKIKVWVVNGELVRDLFFLDFTEGGHDKVYSFVPEEEIWIDDDLSSKEIPFVLLHELHERNLMNQGMDYDSAHRSSSAIEYKCRHKPRQTQKRIKYELLRIR